VQNNTLVEKNMSKTLSFIAIGLLAAGAAFAQSFDSSMPVHLGLKVGIPVTDMLSASNTGNMGPQNSIPGSNFSAHAPRYTFGASAEFHMPLHLRFEVDTLYKRGGFNSVTGVGPGAFVYRPTSFNWWEFPGVFKYNITMGHVRPFIDFGASLRHISTITETTYAPGLAQGVIGNNSSSLHNRNSFGGVAGIGITFKKGPFELTPEARYTRWANQAFMSGNGGLKTNLDQGDVLLGISF
jgi:Outer membrane protein beta-barrel domain